MLSNKNREECRELAQYVLNGLNMLMEAGHPLWKMKTDIDNLVKLAERDLEIEKEK